MPGTIFHGVKNSGPDSEGRVQFWLYWRRGSGYRAQIFRARPEDYEVVWHESEQAALKAVWNDNKEGDNMTPALAPLTPEQVGSLLRSGGPHPRVWAVVLDDEGEPDGGPVGVSPTGEISVVSPWTGWEYSLPVGRECLLASEEEATAIVFAA